MATAVSFLGSPLPAVQGPALDKLLAHIVEKQQEKVGFMTEGGGKQTVVLSAVETGVQIPDEARASFLALVSSACAKGDVDAVVRSVFLFCTAPLTTPEGGGEVLDLTAPAKPQKKFVDTVAASANNRVVGKPPRPPLDREPAEPLEDRIFAFLKDHADGATFDTICAEFKKTKTQQLSAALDTLFFAEKIQAVVQDSGKVSRRLYRLPAE